MRLEMWRLETRWFPSSLHFLFESRFEIESRIFTRVSFRNRDTKKFVVSRHRRVSFFTRVSFRHRVSKKFVGSCTYKFIVYRISYNKEYRTIFHRNFHRVSYHCIVYRVSYNFIETRSIFFVTR